MNADKLAKVRTIAGGDRCNGGLAWVEVGRDGIAYSVNATPPDVIAASKEGAALKLKPYSDLEASAASCVALLEYADTMSGPELKAAELGQAVALGPALDDRRGWTEKYRYQACFNALVRSYLQSGKPRLDAAALEQFAKDFKQRCVAKGASLSR